MYLRNTLVRPVLVAMLWVSVGLAAPFTSGNIAVCTQEVLYEYTPAGDFVQSFAIPFGEDPRPVTESARDIAVKFGGMEVQVYNGTFTPYLSTLDPVASTWSHQTFAGWSTQGNVTYGGIAIKGSYVFVTDMVTTGLGSPEGVIRFESGGSTTRFLTTVGPKDLNVGLNGLLYVLNEGSDVVYILDPVTMSQQQSFNLDFTIGNGDYRSIAANATGQLFAVTYSGALHKTDTSGNSLLSVNLVGTLSGNVTDVDVSDSGMVVVGDTGGGVTVTDESFASPTHFNVGSSDVFVAVQTNATVPVSLSTFTLE